MPTNIPTNPNKKPHGVSLRFGFAIGILFLFVVLAFFWSHHTQPPPYDAKQFAMNGVNGSWYKRDFASPVPSAAPTPAPMPAPRLIAPAQVYRPAPAPTPDMAAEERRRILMRAMSSDLSVKLDGTNVLEMPRRDPRQLTVSLKPAPPHTIVAWSYLYATLETGISSDHPGDVIARVSQDARDSVTQTEVLIPMGSKLHGIERGSGQVGINDTSIIVTWDDLTLPNGAHIPLPKMPAADTQGYPGLSDEVDRHLAATWGPALAISAITAGVMLAQNPTYGGYQGYSGMQEATGAFANSLGTHATQQLNAALMIAKPTIVVRPGAPFRVLLTRDLVFPGPYEG
jgi:hypothetical protein